MMKTFLIDMEAVIGYEMGLKPGTIVYGRFTNAGKSHMFKGEYIASTKNYHKIKALENFRQDPLKPGYPLYEEIGRIFHIETTKSRKWSINNTIVAPEWII
jgi:hypothetical protein